MLAAMRHETEIDWRRRVDRTIHTIMGSLDSPPDLEGAAKDAASSPWRFHRCFKAMTGEGFAACLRRLRMERSAYRLKAGSSVIEAALEAGFETPEAFSRAFRKAFQLNPSAISGLPWWKGELAAPNDLHYRPDRGTAWYSPDEKGLAQRARIVNLPRQRIASMSGSGDPWRLPVLWKALGQTLARDGRSANPGGALTVFEPGATYRAAFILMDDTRAPAGTEETELPGGLYAATVFFGPCEGIGPFWDDWRERFFDSSGWMRDPTRPSLEWYQNEPPYGLPELSLTLLCDPLRRPPSHCPG